MAKRRGKPRQRIRRTADGKRQRLAERVRCWAEAKLRETLDLPGLDKDRGSEFGVIADPIASSFLYRVCRLEGEFDPELYCCSPVTSNDDEDEY